MAERDSHQLTLKIQGHQEQYKGITAAHNRKPCALPRHLLKYFPRLQLESFAGNWHDVPSRAQQFYHNLLSELKFLLPAHWMVYRPFFLLARKFENFQHVYCKLLMWIRLFSDFFLQQFFWKFEAVFKEIAIKYHQKIVTVFVFEIWLKTIVIQMFLRSHFSCCPEELVFVYYQEKCLVKLRIFINSQYF